MTAPIFIGILLVLGTWLTLLLALLGFGRWIALLTNPTPGEGLTTRAGLWWGLGIATFIIMALSLVTPLRSSVTSVVLVLTLVGLGVLGLAIRGFHRPKVQRPTLGILAILIAFACSVTYLALKALGPATNYDTGMYHLGAIKYVGDFGTIPGLATLFFPFGYANAQFPLAAVLGNGPWDGVGYRLLNGLLVALLVTDVSIRLIKRVRTWGTYVLLVGASASLIPIIALADSIVTSPTSDTTVLILSLVSGGYLADALAKKESCATELSVVLVASAVMIAMRPTMLIYTITVVVVVILVALQRKTTWFGHPRTWIFPSGLILLLAVTVAMRDRVLSGWLLYPLSLVPLNVPWQANDPTAPRDATLAAARDATAPDQFVVAHTWEWIPNWIARLPAQWEPWFILTGLLTAAFIFWLAWRRARMALEVKLIVIGCAPSLLAVITWFLVSPPSFRFIWGPLFLLLYLPLGAALVALDRAEQLKKAGLDVLSWVSGGCAATILIVTSYSVLARNQVSEITEPREWRIGSLVAPYAVAPIPLPPVVEVPMSSGLVLVTPDEGGGDQCWDNYPLCSFSMGSDIALRGESIGDGFIRE